MKLDPQGVTLTFNSEYHEALSGDIDQVITGTFMAVSALMRMAEKAERDAGAVPCFKDVITPLWAAVNSMVPGVSWVRGEWRMRSGGAGLFSDGGRGLERRFAVGDLIAEESEVMEFDI